MTAGPHFQRGEAATAAMAWPLARSAFLPFLELANRARLREFVRALTDPMAIRA